jgi:isocitrate lyase
MEATIKITKEQFKAYVRVQRSGFTNMWDVQRVQNLSGLKRGDCLEIMKHYGELAEKYPDVWFNLQQQRISQK